jgi:hypothetical protein
MKKGVVMQRIGAADLRRWEREMVALPVSIVLDADKFESETSATMMNISLSGAAIRTSLELVPGQELKIVIKGKFSRAISARVIWVRQDNSSNWPIVGIKFLAYPITKAAKKLQVSSSLPEAKKHQ